MNSIKLILFDLGGVIVELRGAPLKTDWLGVSTEEEVWRIWLTSDTPRAFEMGKLSADEFAKQMVEDLDLSISPAEFKEHFRNWPIGLYPGALELLKTLKQSHKVALFSNSNVLHWERKMGEMGLAGVFDYEFASHLIQRVKPDAESFGYVLGRLEYSPAEVLFLDDNAMNVEAARSLAMRAERVKGLGEVKDALQTYGLL